MRARAAQIQMPNRRGVARPPEQRPRDEELIERQLAVKDVAAGQSVGPFEIERRDHLAREDGGPEAGRVALDRARRGVAQAIAFARPMSPSRGDMARTARTRRRRAGRGARARDRRSMGWRARSTAPRRSRRTSRRRTRARCRRRRAPAGPGPTTPTPAVRADRALDEPGEPRQRRHGVVHFGERAVARGCSARDRRSPAPGASDPAGRAACAWDRRQTPPRARRSVRRSSA